MDKGTIVRDKRRQKIILSNLAVKDEILLGNFGQVIYLPVLQFRSLLWSENNKTVP